MAATENPAVTVVDERGALQVRHGRSVDPKFVELLSSTRFGTDKLKYRRRRVADTLDRLPGTDYYSVFDEDELIGGYALTPVEITFGDRKLNALYRHSLVVGEDRQGEGVGRWLVDAALADRAGQPDIDFSFGSIESGNRRSASLLSDSSSQSLAILRSELLYRQLTRRSEQVTCNPDEALIRASLEIGESDCLYRFASRRGAPYYAVIQDGRILAGASARLNSIDLLSQGLSPGRLYSSMVRMLPAARRRFDPADFRFVSLSDIVIDRDGARAWNALVGHVMYEFGAHMASITLDPRRTTYRVLRELGLLGRFAKATREEFLLLARPHSDIGFEALDQPTALAPLDL